MRSALDWKKFYHAERAALGEAGLRRLVEEAPRVGMPRGGALVFPHARLAVCGSQIAAVAAAVVRSRASEVVALGVLHGAREQDADLVAQARAGDPAARERLRRAHRGEQGYTAEEFSLDHFCDLVVTAAQQEGVACPRLMRFFPFLVGDSPNDLPGLDEIQRAVASGAALVATADPVHHGAGYGTAVADRLPLDDPRTIDRVRTMITDSLALLVDRDVAGFQRHCTEVKSDFRDTGPTMIAALGGAHPLRATIHDLRLVDYAQTLSADQPTWVAAALIAVDRP